MENNSEVESFSQNDSVSSIASNARYREDAILLEQQSLFQLLQKAISETNEEHIAFGKEISPLLNKLSLESQFLPNDIKEGLQKVALIMRSEKLADFNDATLNIVKEREKIEEKKRQHEEKQLSLLYDDIFRKHTIFSKKLNNLQEAVSSLESFIEDAQKEHDDNYCNRVSLSTKLQEYQQTTEKLETDLLDMQIEDVYPQKILNKYNRYLEMSGELAELNQCLNQYGDLPPNLLQAKALLEVKQKEYETLENTFLEKTSYS
ncbi:uncharacterized protein LOC117601054 [Osmia lignaria lignaria]|uniref:uncharacterized protein LOC117601054 n=1 Tax=Osmia lignaria lignaria TaxID=1437193 RepID=UPI00147901A6|nr:uncharacterized protein LOC117601054 [Osmia lignaria]XP_034173207.1 uncharacterized protein LOC117601054 [Osmia lignaria]